MTHSDDQTRRASAPRVLPLGNGRLFAWVEASGGGALRLGAHALTRWHPDPTLPGGGARLYVRDAADGRVVRVGAASGDTRVRELAHARAIEHAEAGIALRLEVAVAPDANVELRRVRLANEGDAVRALDVVHYAEVALGRPVDDERHPAFSKLFVRAEAAAPGALVFTRRPRGPGDRAPALAVRALGIHGDVALAGFEADRAAFLGRRGDVERPQALPLPSAGATGFTLDPCAALGLRVTLPARAHVELAFLSAAGERASDALAAAQRLATPAALDAAFAAASAHTEQERAQLGLAADAHAALPALASALLVPAPALACAPALRFENRLGQAALWQLGISGDSPILLVRARDAEGPLLAQLARALPWFAQRGVAFDLVVEHTGAALGTRIREQIGAAGQLHLVDAELAAPESLRGVAVAARVVLDGARGLEAMLAATPAPLALAPSFAPRRAPAPRGARDPSSAREPLALDNGLGGFSADGREYTIHLAPGQTTPAPWSNVLANDGFGCLTTESGIACSWSQSSGENRLTPWSNDAVCDPPGEALHLRDEESGELWSVTPRPAGPASACEVRHGACETRWRRECFGLAQEQRVFVAPDAPCAVVELRLENRGDRPRRISVTYYAEWLLGSLPSLARPHVVAEWDAASETLLARNPWSVDCGERVAFLAASRPAAGACTDRGAYLGAGGITRPDALARARLAAGDPASRDACGALQVQLELAPGERATCAFAIGQGRDRAHALALAAEWRKPERQAAADAAREAWWNDVLGAVSVRTPDAAFDLLANRWLLQQTLASRLFARAGFQQAGGAYGFRDQLQDVMALRFADPARTRAHLLRCAAHQLEAGDVLHWWHPGAERGLRTRCSDDLLWLPWAVAQYVRATGDAAVLDERVPFLRAPELAAGERDRYAQFAETGEVGSLFEHCARALARGVTRGARGLPRIGTCDWNDGFDRLGERGEGESVWLGWFALAALRDFAAIADRARHAEEASRWRAQADAIEAALARSAWDGAWYVRAWDDDGRSVGAHGDDEWRIDSIAQSWAVLSGAHTEGRARSGVAAALRALAPPGDSLARLAWPPFADSPREPGYIKSYPPGVRENGGQYAHAAVWLAWACADLGDGDTAFDLLGRIHPLRRAATPAGVAHYRAEPYVIAADVYGAAPHDGRGGWTWYTGSAGWTYRLAVERILGLQLDAGRLALRPCLPSAWPGYEARVRGRAGAIAVRVVVDAALAPGERALAVDGAAAPDAPIAFPRDGTTRQVALRVGPARRDVTLR